MIFRSKGFTLIELVATVAIVAILASAALPMLQMTVQRSKAIDAYKKIADTKDGPIKKIEGQTGYPPNLDVLVEGVIDEKSPNKNKIRFLRRLPLDPMQPVSEDSEKSENGIISNWGVRSYASEANEPKEGDDVYDVYSLSPQVGINGVPYAQW
jgi:general secretion pathway protein G